MGKTHSQFAAALHDSHDIVWAVAEFLTEKGNTVKILPGTLAPSKEENKDHVDLGDIEIIRRIEVKRRPGIDFDSVASFPYPTVIVDEEYKINKFHPKTLYGYAVVNKSKTGMLWIPASTRKRWTSEVKPDDSEDRECTFVVCPKELTIYVPLKEAGHE